MLFLPRYNGLAGMNAERACRESPATFPCGFRRHPASQFIRPKPLFFQKSDWTHNYGYGPVI